MKFATRGSTYRALCSRVVSALKEARMFAEAAVVLRDYLDDPEEAIASLVEGSRWDEADRLIVREDRADLHGEMRVNPLHNISRIDYPLRDFSLVNASGRPKPITKGLSCSSLDRNICRPAC